MTTASNAAWVPIGFGPARVYVTGQAAYVRAARSTPSVGSRSPSELVQAGAFVDIFVGDVIWALGAASSASTVTTGTTSATRNQPLVASYLKLDAMKVEDLPPASQLTGAIFFVTDATSATNGTTVSGGGSTPVLARSNGTLWQVIG